MGAGDAKSQVCVGFLSILDLDSDGLIGGYLILNSMGRPLEFHCTAPVKPNRAQQILFGPTLEPYLYGEQIGQTLVNKGSAEPLALCIDGPRTLAVRDYVSLPVALVLPPANDANPSDTKPDQPFWRVDPPHSCPSGLSVFPVGSNRLAVARHREDDRRAIMESFESVPLFDLNEPFQRIREAIEEAQKGSRS